MSKTVSLCAWSLGMLLFWISPAQAQQVFTPGQSQPQTVQSVLPDLTQADVVYLGETHDRRADHEAQLQIIQELHRSNPQLAIGMEMFQLPYQGVIDQYLAGEITEAQLRQQTQYDRRWGFPWANYAPILRYAQANQLPVLALNVPTEVTQRVAAKGLSGLTARDRQWIPPLEEIRTDNADYRQFLQDLYNDFHQEFGSSADFDRFVLSQVLWDETMAQGIAEFMQNYPDRQVVVLTGQGHIMYGYGIPSRVARRLGATLVQRSILLNPTEDARAEMAIADYFWMSPNTDFEQSR
jgi:uncharacterized iron-regulated protein